jgi:hypothetical protein
MEASKEPLPSEKDPAAIRKYFEKVYPEMDFERVYASDMKKMIKWFTALKKNDIAIKLRDEEQDKPEDEAATAAAAEEPVAVEETAAEEPAPKKKRTTRKKTENK